jgi:phage/plasmid-like protein (TIGR03299 family)
MSNTSKNNMSKEEIIFEILQATGLNWTVTKENMYVNTAVDDLLVVPDAYASIRSDSNGYLGIVGSRYEHLQNHEMVSIAYDAGKEVFSTDLQLKHPWNNAETLGSFGNMGGGSLRGGSRVFVQMELPELHIGKSGIKRFITLTNSHDGSMSLGFGTTNQVICCKNTFAIANRDISKIRHTSSMQQRIDEAVQSLRKVLTFEDAQMQVFEIASTRRFERQHIADIVSSVFGKSITTSAVDVSSKTKNNMAAFAADIDRSIDEQGETLWALFNAVTRYTNHTSVSRDKDYSLMFGSDAETNERAYQTLLSWINEPSLVMA